MRVGVIDVGANTLRLLVATQKGGGVAPVHTGRAALGLGEHIETSGSIPRRKLAQAERAASEQAGVARHLGCERVEIVVTSPGRQAQNASELVEILQRVKGAGVRVLSAEEEGVYAYEGALAGVADLPECVAVCDVGGGSTQIVVGTRDGGPAWQRSIDLGSLRLTERALRHDPPTAEDVARAHAVVEELVGTLAPPLPQAAFATGGSARALGKLVGGRLSAAELDVALRIASQRPSRRLVKAFGISPRRAHTLVAGAILVSAVHGLLGVTLHVARGGLREGVARRLLAEAAVAA
jgi:exopolyphosphatase / guanosine-5'-triphosphate,3'-diphosphate pyrophosphatase